MVLETYPLDNVDYSAEDAELFHCTRTSGIYANDDFDYSVTGADNTITIGVGLGWIRNSRFSGKVAALKAATALDLGLPDAVYSRIDAVVIQFDANKNGTEVVVKRGVAASVPVPPAVSRTEALYELHLYHVRREPGAAAVYIPDITDLRLDPNYCGLMGDSVTKVDTAAISAQVTALIEALRLEIGNVKDGSAYLMRSGGNMTGAINMNGQKISGLNNPTTDNEPATKGYVDTTKMSMELLWENGSPTSEFGEDYVNLDLSPFYYIAIEFAPLGTSYRKTAFCVVGGNCLLDGVAGSGTAGLAGSHVVAAWRNAKTSDKTKVEFSKAVRQYVDSSSVGITDANGYVIPTRIYGIKGVIK